MKRSLGIALLVVIAAAAIFIFMPVRKLGIGSPTEIAASEMEKKPKRAPDDSLASSEFHGDLSNGKSDPKPSEGLPSNIQELELKIRMFAESKKFPSELLSAILNGPFPKNTKWLALQAFHQVHYSKPSELYHNSQTLIEFIEKSLPELDQAGRAITNDILQRLNDDENPNKESVDQFIAEKFNEYKGTDKEKASLFLRNITDQDKVVEVMKEGDPYLSDVAKSYLPHIASPMMVKKIVTSDKFNADEKATAMGKVAQSVDGKPRENGMTDADALIIWAKDLDRKHGTGDKFQKAVLQGISLSKHQNREQFLVDGMKKSLEPYRKVKGQKSHNDIPELSAVFNYLVELPDQSPAYDFFIAELNRMSSGQCPDTQADHALNSLISFWQYACDMSVSDCPERAKTNANYKTISDKYMTLKGRCPAI